MRHHVHQIQVLMADAANQHMAVLHVHQDGRILYLNARMQSLTNLTETDVRRPVSLFTGGGNQFLATVLGARTELINAANIGQTVRRSRSRPCFAEVCLLTLRCLSPPGLCPSIMSLKKLPIFSGFTQSMPKQQQKASTMPVTAW